MSWPSKPRFEKIERGLRHLGGGHERGVVGIDDGVDADRGERAVLVLVGRIDRLGALGLEQHERARLLPLAEVLDGLEDRRGRFPFSCCELLVDLLVEAVAQAAGEGDGDAGKALLKVLDPAVMRPARPRAVEHQRFLELRLLVQRVDAFGMRERRATAERRDEQHQASAAASTTLRMVVSSLRQVGLSYILGIRSMAEKAEQTGRERPDATPRRGSQTVPRRRAP